MMVTRWFGRKQKENIKNKPHQSYISLLKKHRLWIDYKKTIQGLKEKEKDKDKDIVKEKEFSKFWDLYGKKVGDKEKLLKKFSALSDKDISAIMKFIPKYKESQPNKKYRKNPETFLNNKSWLDEIIEDNDSNKEIVEF